MAGKPLKTARPRLHADPKTGAFSVSWTHYDPETNTSKTVRRGCMTKDEAEAWAVVPGIVAAYSDKAKVRTNWTLGDLIDAYILHRELDPNPDKRPSRVPAGRTTPSGGVRRFPTRRGCVRPRYG